VAPPSGSERLLHVKVNERALTPSAPSSQRETGVQPSARPMQGPGLHPQHRKKSSQKTWKAGRMKPQCHQEKKQKMEAMLPSPTQSCPWMEPNGLMVANNPATPQPIHQAARERLLLLAQTLLGWGCEHEAGKHSSSTQGHRPQAEEDSICPRSVPTARGRSTRACPGALSFLHDCTCHGASMPSPRPGEVGGRGGQVTCCLLQGVTSYGSLHLCQGRKLEDAMTLTPADSLTRRAAHPADGTLHLCSRRAQLAGQSTPRAQHAKEHSLGPGARLCPHSNTHTSHLLTAPGMQAHPRQQVSLFCCAVNPFCR
jgi:hypothetical protein